MCHHQISRDFHSSPGTGTDSLDNFGSFGSFQELVILIKLLDIDKNISSFNSRHWMSSLTRDWSLQYDAAKRQIQNKRMSGTLFTAKEVFYFPHLLPTPSFTSHHYIAFHENLISLLTFKESWISWSRSWKPLPQHRTSMKCNVLTLLFSSYIYLLFIIFFILLYYVLSILLLQVLSVKLLGAKYF